MKNSISPAENLFRDLLALPKNDQEEFWKLVIKSDAWRETALDRTIASMCLGAWSTGRVLCGYLGIKDKSIEDEDIRMIFQGCWAMKEKSPRSIKETIAWFVARGFAWQVVMSIINPNLRIVEKKKETDPETVLIAAKLYEEWGASNSSFSIELENLLKLKKFLRKREFAGNIKTLDSENLDLDIARLYKEGHTTLTQLFDALKLTGKYPELKLTAIKARRWRLEKAGKLD